MQLRKVEQPPEMGEVTREIMKEEQPGQRVTACASRTSRNVPNNLICFCLLDLRALSKKPQSEGALTKDFGL